MQYRPEIRARDRGAEALRPCGLIARGEAAKRLCARLLASRDDELDLLEGVGAAGLIALLGPSEALPWVDGLTYLRRAADPRLLLPTTLEIDVPAHALATALLQAHPELEAPLALDPEGPTILSLAPGRPLARAELVRWMEGEL